MTYTQQGDRVTLEMTREDYERLMMMLGIALGFFEKREDKRVFWRWVEFTNELNNGNPNYTPYEIPPEFTGEISVS